MFYLKTRKTTNFPIKIEVEYMNQTLNKIKTEVYEKCNLKISNLEIELESKEYHACKFKLNTWNILSRKAKITPTKAGQFVTCWRRNKDGITEPFDDTDPIDFYTINVQHENLLGQFVFPRSVLIKHGIMSTEKKDGKRGFRVYPAWDKAENKQAEKTQKWQLNYFYDIGKSTDFKKVLALYHGL
ncbi:MepB family protein [Bizionia arctica]|uniref:MepB family protein n=1 Tax=Bizionia arctica TaxID=1495645 RepID=A0A917GBN6_9FLAO|nr:MepB family protein [Bizionia arctica]GGG35599.1 hypothetical protein GCM10010976_04110 [Bizionia arctica]